MTARSEFEALLAEHRIVPVTREVFADGETPVEAYRKVRSGKGTFLLESAEQGVWNRYSFIGARASGLLIGDAAGAHWVDQGLSRQRALGDATGTALELLETLLERWRTPRIPGMPRLAGGVVGHLGWEVVRELEALPHAPAREIQVPDVAFAVIDDLVVLDHRTGTAVLVALALNDGADADALWSDAQARLDRLQHALAQPAPPSLSAIDMSAPTTPEARVDREQYEAMVERSKTHIVDGDVFQVVLSTRFDTSTSASALDIYRVLRRLNPSPYLYLLELADADGHPYEVIGSSPEALVTVSEGRATMHPIAGSRPRGATTAEDQRLGEELLADPKERSEHVMLVDLARNDLSKVCVPGTVDVSDFMTVERFSHIMHIVSTVEGRLREDATALDAFRATFPAGTLSGAPKPRALQIIDELEPAGRGIYGGVAGYFEFSGDADLAIAIRTVTLKDERAYVQAGAGLVADSVPATEYEEAWNKSAAPLRAVAIAETLKPLADV